MSLHRLRGGGITTDPRLDRLAEFDPRSRDWPAIRLLSSEQAAPRTHTWPIGISLDQGDIGACVGFSAAHNLAAEPEPVPMTEQDAYALYVQAKELDQFPGSDYEGSSVLGGAKAAQALGLLAEYRWCFGADDLALSVSWTGPAVIGVNWYASMMQPDASGLLKVEGEPAGGHAICVIGYVADLRLFRLKNSWGGSWGIGGDCFISFEDLDRLLHEDGEAMIPIYAGQGS